jgi:hypothetical protein
MKTLTINTAGKKSNAYFTEDVKTSVSLNGKLKTKVSIKEAKKILINLPIYCQGVNYKTYKIN